MVDRIERSVVTPFPDPSLVKEGIVVISEIERSVTVTKNNFPKLNAELKKNETIRVHTFTTKTLPYEIALQYTQAETAPSLSQIVIFQKILSIPSITDYSGRKNGEGYDLDHYNRTDFSNPNIDLLTAFFLAREKLVDPETGEVVSRPNQIQKVAKQENVRYDFMALRMAFSRLVNRYTIDRLKIPPDQLESFYESVAKWQYMITRHIVENDKTNSALTASLIPFFTETEEENIPYPQFLPYMGKAVVDYITDLKEFVPKGMDYRADSIPAAKNRFAQLSSDSVKVHLMTTSRDYEDALADIERRVEKKAASGKLDGTLEYLKAEKRRIIGAATKNKLREMLRFAIREESPKAEGIIGIIERTGKQIDQIRILYGFYLDHPQLLKRGNEEKDEEEQR